MRDSRGGTGSTRRPHGESAWCAPSLIIGSEGWWVGVRELFGNVPGKRVLAANWRKGDWRLSPIHTAGWERHPAQKGWREGRGNSGHARGRGGPPFIWTHICNGRSARERRGKRGEGRELPPPSIGGGARARGWAVCVVALGTAQVGVSLFSQSVLVGSADLTGRGTRTALRAPRLERCVRCLNHDSRTQQSSPVGNQ